MVMGPEWGQRWQRKWPWRRRRRNGIERERRNKGSGDSHQNLKLKLKLSLKQEGVFSSAAKHSLPCFSRRIIFILFFNTYCFGFWGGFIRYHFLKKMTFFPVKYLVPNKKRIQILYLLFGISHSSPLGFGVLTISYGIFCWLGWILMKTVIFSI